MTTTMLWGDPPKYHDTPAGAERSCGPRHGHGLFEAILRPLFASVASGSARRTAPIQISPAVDREVSAIDNFAQFLFAHPDMPSEHRARFLQQILKSCEAIRKEATWPAPRRGRCDN